VQQAPEVEADDEIDEEDEQKLRVYYSIDLADQEFRSEPRSYAAQVPEGDGPSRKVTDELESKDSGSGDSESDSDSDEGDEDEEEEEKRDSDEKRDSQDGRSDSEASEDDSEGSEREGEPEAQSS
jgi:hypothetical protein